MGKNSTNTVIIVEVMHDDNAGEDALVKLQEKICEVGGDKVDYTILAYHDGFGRIVQRQDTVVS